MTFKEAIDYGDSDFFTIITITSEIFKFKSFEAPTIFKWLNYLLTMLKKKSTYAVATQSFTKEDTSDESYLELKRGDLITLEQSGDLLTSSSSLWAVGTSKNKKGYFPIDSVTILPCIMEPKKEIVDLYARDKKKQVPERKSQYNTLQRQKMYNLRKYAQDNFRPNIE